jgi:hypothetical protein
MPLPSECAHFELKDRPAKTKREVANNMTGRSGARDDMASRVGESGEECEELMRSLRTQ